MIYVSLKNYINVIQFHNFLTCVLWSVVSSYVWPHGLQPIGSSVPGTSWEIPWADISLEWLDISFSRGSPQPRNQSCVSSTAGRFFTCCAMAEALLTFWQSNVTQEGILGMDGCYVHLAVTLKCQMHKQSFRVELLDRDLSIHVLNECCSGQSSRWLT